MSPARLLFVTGKGGVGKTTVSAALGRHFADAGQRTLIIETASDGSLAQLFGRKRLAAAPQRLLPALDAIRVDARQLIEAYFRKLLRVTWLSDRLLASGTFNALTAAAPGITEFLLLERILEWVEPGLTRRRPYDRIIVDGPATGHALKLLATPRRLASIVARAPIGTVIRRLVQLLEDSTRTQAVLVSLPEEMSVREAIEARRVLRHDLGIDVVRPVVNRVFPAYFSAEQIAQLRQSPAGTDDQTADVFAAARYAIARRREARRQIHQLRVGIGATPVVLEQIYGEHLTADDLRICGQRIAAALGGKE